MFKSIQGIMQKASHKPEKTDKKKLLPVLTADALLRDKNRRTIVRQFPKLLSFSDENFKNLATPVINNFAEFVQQLPETRNSFYSQLGGLMDHALERSRNSMILIRNYFLPDGNDNAPLTQPQTLWAYTIFTAGILHDIGKVNVDFIVEMYDQNRGFIKNWGPFTGDMIGQGDLYDYEFDNAHPHEFKKRVTMLMARQLMPEEGFNWIASNKDVLHVWLALLDDDYRGAGVLGKVFMRADALAIQQNLAKLLEESHNFDVDEKVVSKFADMDDTEKKSEEKTQKTGDPLIDFLNWLKSGLAEQQYMLNKSPLFYVPGGMLMTSDIFKYFSNQFGYSEGEVVGALKENGLVEVNEKGEAKKQVTRNYGKDKSSTIDGVILKNPDIVLPSEFKVLSNPVEGQYLTKSSAQSIHLMTSETLVNAKGLANNFIVKVAGAATASQYIATNGQLVSQGPKAAIEASPNPFVTMK